jgi:putative transposase
MNDKGRCCDNVFVERFWMLIKYEHVYLHACESVQKGRAKISHCIDFHDTTRPHSSLNTLTPDQVYFNYPPETLVA